MGYLRFFALLAVVGMACDSRAQGTKEVWLDELDLSCCIQDWGLPQADRSVLDTPLTVGGVVYGRGVGTQPYAVRARRRCRLHRRGGGRG